MHAKRREPKRVRCLTARLRPAALPANVAGKARCVQLLWSATALSEFLTLHAEGRRRVLSLQSVSAVTVPFTAVEGHWPKRGGVAVADRTIWRR